MHKSAAAAAAAKSLQLCPTLCDPIDGSPSGSSVPGIFKARTLEWVAISFSNACMHAKSLQSCPTLLHKSRLFFISHFSVKFDKVDVFLSLVPRKTAKWIVKKYHFLFVLQRSFLALREKLNLTELIRQGRFCSRLSQKEREIEHTLLK